MIVLGFGIWYANGSSQQARDWTVLPSENVLFVYEYFDERYEGDYRYRRVIDGCDWYWFDGESVQGVRSEETGEQPKPDVEGIKQGVQVSDEQFLAIERLAAAALTFDG